MTLSTLKIELSRYLEVDKIYFAFKGRVTLYGLLQAIGIREGDEVILQGFTCVVVANAILYLKATPVYVDIELNTFNTSATRVQKAITTKTKAIICQNTFGLSSELNEIQALAKERGIFTIEDCTHGFGGTYNGVPNGTTCDAAIFSTQWSKPFSSGVGGFAIVENPDLQNRMTTYCEALEPPSMRQNANLQLLIWFRRLVLRDWNYWPMIRLYRWLSHKNIVVGSSSGDELSGIEMPGGYLQGFGSVQAREALRSLKRLPAMLERRRKNAQVFTDFLVKHNKNHVAASLFGNHAYLRYPLLVNDQQAVKQRAIDKRIELGDWFNSPLYPIEGSLGAWGLDESRIPNALVVSRHIVNLPTDAVDISKVINFLDEIVDQILSVEDVIQLRYVGREPCV